MPYNAEQNQQDNQNQNPNNQQQANNQSGQNLSGSGDTGTVGAGASGNGRVANFSAGTQAGQVGSGRYTNLQKYLGANQGATDRLYQGINNRIEQTANPQKQQAQTEADKVREGITQGNQALQRGQGYYNQMQDQNFNAQNFASDQNRLDDYSKFRNGQAVDQNALNTQNTTAQTANVQAQNLYSNRLNQASNEAGRFDLLKETFGGRNAYKPTYSSGQQRLDQLFLQAGTGNKVGQLQNDIRGNINSLNQNLAGLQGKSAEEIKALADQQAALSGNIQNKANSLETGYIDNLQGQVAGVNAARDAERAKYRGFTDQLIQSGQGKETSTPLDAALYNEAQLRDGEQVFNFFKNPTLTADQFLNVNTANANDYHDIAKQQNVNYYDALAKLAGINNSKLNAVGSLIDPTTGELNRAATLKTGDGSLRQGIDQAQQDFIKKAMQDTITGHGEDSGTDSWLGRGSTAEANLNVNVRDLLNGLTPTTANGYAPDQPNVGDVTGVLNPAEGLRNLEIKGLFGGQDLLHTVGGQISGLAGTDSGSMSAAQARAENALYDNIKSYLGNTGFNNYMTRSGVKDNSSIGNQQIDTNRAADKFNRDNSWILNSDTKDLAKNLAGIQNASYGAYDGTMSDYSRTNKSIDDLTKQIDSYRQAGVQDTDTSQAQRIQQLNAAQNQLNDIVRTQYQPYAQSLQAQSRQQQQDLADKQAQLRNDFYTRLGLTPPPENTTGVIAGSDPMTLEQVKNRFSGK